MQGSSDCPEWYVQFFQPSLLSFISLCQMTSQAEQATTWPVGRSSALWRSPARLTPAEAYGDLQILVYGSSALAAFYFPSSPSFPQTTHRGARGNHQKTLPRLLCRARMRLPRRQTERPNARIPLIGAIIGTKFSRVLLDHLTDMRPSSTTSEGESPSTNAPVKFELLHAEFGRHGVPVDSLNGMPLGLCLAPLQFELQSQSDPGTQ